MSHPTPLVLNCSYRQSSLPSGSRNCPVGPVLPRTTDSEISGRRLASALSPVHSNSEAAPSSLLLGAGWGRRMRSHQITETSAVFLPLRTIAIETTSCCYHGNHAVPACFASNDAEATQEGCCKALVLSVLRSPVMGPGSDSKEPSK